MSAFPLPIVHVNSVGWGPTESNVPEQFRDLPFAPFGIFNSCRHVLFHAHKQNTGKGDLGKGFRAADFTANSFTRYPKFRQRSDGVLFRL
jgi:hypothetical protein